MKGLAPLNIAASWPLSLFAEEADMLQIMNTLIDAGADLNSRDVTY